MDTSLTDFDFTPAESGESDKTDCISNQAFLLATFGNEQSDMRPLAVSFAGNPAKVQKSAWSGRPWIGNTATELMLPPHANNYFSLAVFRPDEAGNYRRKKRNSMRYMR